MIEKNKKINLIPIGASWRKKVDKIKEYERLTKERFNYGDFISSFMPLFEFEQGQKLKHKLLKEYKNKLIEEIFNGEILETKKGPCYCLTNDSDVKIIKPDSDTARGKILGCTKLLYGIGDFKQQRLKESGFNTIADLINHPVYGKEAKDLMILLEQVDTLGLMEVCYRWLPKSHPLVFSLTGFHNLEDFIFLDIETMGLHSRPIILFGIAYFQKDRLCIKQYLLRSIADESAALMATLTHVKPNTVFISYNGKSYDIPYIMERAAFYRLRTQLDHPHFDLLHFSRRLWRGKLPDCSLKTIEEEVIGVKRTDDVPSALIPDFYATYLREDNPGPLVPIVEHNRHDLIALAQVFSLLWQQMDK